MIEPNPRNDITLPALSALATLKAENALPIDAMEPTLPIDPMDNVEERLQILSIESCDAIDHRDDMTVSLPQQSARVCTTGHGVQRRSADTLRDGIKHHVVGNLHTVDLGAD
ncbi:MAG: hypothetical protein Q4P23_15510 [Micrococcaceae bacterium]|nr:hypothetical protein [Micrococcaceae bacterium]